MTDRGDSTRAATTDATGPDDHARAATTNATGFGDQARAAATAGSGPDDAGLRSRAARRVAPATTARPAARRRPRAARPSRRAMTSPAPLRRPRAARPSRPGPARPARRRPSRAGPASRVHPDGRRYRAGPGRRHAVGRQCPRLGRVRGRRRHRQHADRQARLDRQGRRTGRCPSLDPAGTQRRIDRRSLGPCRGTRHRYLRRPSQEDRPRRQGQPGQQVRPGYRGRRDHPGRRRHRSRPRAGGRRRAGYRGRSHGRGGRRRHRNRPRTRHPRSRHRALPCRRRCRRSAVRDGGLRRPGGGPVDSGPAGLAGQPDLGGDAASWRARASGIGRPDRAGGADRVGTPTPAPGAAARPEPGRDLGRLHNRPPRQPRLGDPQDDPTTTTGAVERPPATHEPSAPDAGAVPTPASPALPEQAGTPTATANGAAKRRPVTSTGPGQPPRRARSSPPGGVGWACSAATGREGGEETAGTSGRDRSRCRRRTRSTSTGSPA